MLQDTTKPDWTKRILALYAMSVAAAVVGGLFWMFGTANASTEPRGAIVTTCSGFKADARKLFAMGDAAALTGTFAPGDRVKLAIDFSGIGYAWELSGVLAGTKKSEVTGTGSFTTTTRYSKKPDSVTTKTTHTIGMHMDHSAANEKSTDSRGKISGLAILEFEIDVTAAGEGTLKITKTGKLPSLMSPSVEKASCTPAKKTPPQTPPASATRTDKQGA